MWIELFGLKNKEGYRMKQKITTGTRWRIWLRHCHTSRKVAGSTEIFR